MKIQMFNLNIIMRYNDELEFVYIYNIYRIIKLLTFVASSWLQLENCWLITASYPLNYYFFNSDHITICVELS